VESEQGLNELGILPILGPEKMLSTEPNQKALTIVEGGQESSPAPQAPRYGNEHVCKSSYSANQPRKHRRTYSPETKQAIINALKYRRAERIEIVAENLKVPIKTAPSWITRFRKEGENMVLKDRRHEGHSGAVKKMKEHFDDLLIDLLIDWLHFDGGMDPKQMRYYVNREILQDLLLKADIERRNEASH